MQLTSSSSKATTELDVLSEDFGGPVEELGAFGWNRKAYLGIIGPPIAKKYMLCKWDSKAHFKDRRPPIFEIGVLRIVAVIPDPRGAKGFVINVVKEDKVKERLLFEATDR